jgi:hypothetical protein
MEYLSYKRNLRAYTIDIETSLAVKIAGCRPAIAGRRTTLLNARSVFTGHLPEPGYRARPNGAPRIAFWYAAINAGSSIDPW